MLSRSYITPYDPITYLYNTIRSYLLLLQVSGESRGVSLSRVIVENCFSKALASTFSFKPVRSIMSLAIGEDYKEKYQENYHRRTKCCYISGKGAKESTPCSRLGKKV